MPAVRPELFHFSLLAIILFHVEVTDGKTYLDNRIQLDNEVLIRIKRLEESFCPNLNFWILRVPIEVLWENIRADVVDRLPKVRRPHVVHVWVVILWRHENYHICINVRTAERKSQVVILRHDHLGIDVIRTALDYLQGNVLR